MTSLATRVGEVELNSAILTASGTSGHGDELAGYGDLSLLGAVVVKSLAAFAFEGNPPPRVAASGTHMVTPSVLRDRASRRGARATYRHCSLVGRPWWGLSGVAPSRSSLTPPRRCAAPISPLSKSMRVVRTWRIVAKSSRTRPRRPPKWSPRPKRRACPSGPNSAPTRPNFSRWRPQRWTREPARWCSLIRCSGWSSTWSYVVPCGQRGWWRQRTRNTAGGPSGRL